jgi:hypothetical protein
VKVEKGQTMEVDPLRLDLSGVTVPEVVEATPHSPEYARARMRILQALLRRRLGPRALARELHELVSGHPERSEVLAAEALRYEQGETWDEVRKAEEVPF